MNVVPILTAATALLLLAGCGGDDPVPKRAEVSVSIDDDASEAAGIEVDTEDGSGKVAISLPGGLEANIDLPRGMAGDKADTKFDIDGVGLYPGGKTKSFSVRAFSRPGKRAVVKIGFSAPADAAAVADWYQQQFEAKGIAVTRAGEVLTGKQRDGDDFTLAMAPAAGGSAGTLTVVDGGKG